MTKKASALTKSLTAKIAAALPHAALPDRFHSRDVMAALPDLIPTGMCPSKGMGKILAAIARAGVIHSIEVRRVPGETFKRTFYVLGPGEPLYKRKTVKKTEEPKLHAGTVKRVPTPSGHVVRFGATWKPTPTNDGTSRPWRGYTCPLASAE